MKKFEQMKRLYHSLTEYLDTTDLSDKNIAAVTSDFDRLFELSWKTMKAYLFEDLGIYQAKTGSPREIIKIAASEELLPNGEVWLEMLKDRNDDSHIYQKASAIIYMSKIAAKYLPEILKLITLLKERIPQEQWEDAKIPEDLLEYSFLHHKPLYEIVEEIRLKYGCQMDEQVYEKWEEYKKCLQK